MRSGFEQILPCYDVAVQNEFTAYVVQDGEWYVAFCAEVPEGNGQGRTPAEAIEDLAASLALLFEDRREDLLESLPPAREVARVVVTG